MAFAVGTYPELAAESIPPETVTSQDIVSGILIDKGTTVVDGVKHIDFTQVGYLWIGAAVISFILPLFNWKKRQKAL